MTQTLQYINPLPQTDNFAIVKGSRYDAMNVRHDDVYCIQTKPHVRNGITMVPPEANIACHDIENAIRALMVTEGKYQEWQEQNQGRYGRHVAQRSMEAVR